LRPAAHGIVEGCLTCPTTIRSRSGSTGSRRATGRTSAGCGTATSIGWARWPARSCRRISGGRLARGRRRGEPSAAASTPPGGGQFRQLSDRDDLWRLLATITVRKALGTIRHQTRQKRGGGQVLGESALIAGGDGDADGAAEILSREPTPEQVAGFADDYNR